MTRNNFVAWHIFDFSYEFFVRLSQSYQILI